MMKMKYLVVARHGSDRMGDELSEYGRKQMEVLADKLKPHATGRVFIASSALGRAKESAQILLDKLGGKRETFDALEPPEYGFVGTVEKLAKENNLVIVICHLGMSRILANEFGEKVLKMSFGPMDLEYGQACVIDIKKKMLKAV